jgi:hypothetical protein
MSRFLKLGQVIINKNYIQNIQINKDNYVIHLMANKIDGVLLFSSGSLKASNTNFDVCKTKNLSDYKIVTDWINNEMK